MKDYEVLFYMIFLFFFQIYSLVLQKTRLGGGQNLWENGAGQEDNGASTFFVY